MYGYEMVPDGIKNYRYRMKTSNTNCRNHLISRHAELYNATILAKKWPYPLTTDEPGARKTVGQLRKHALPEFTLQSFVDYLVRFIVADDQVSNLFVSNARPHIFLVNPCCRVPRVPRLMYAP